MIDLDIDGPIAIVRICRRERQNALSPQAMVRLREVLIAADTNDGISVIIIPGDGDRAFCAGADISSTTPQESNFISAYFDRETGPDHPLYIRNIAFSRLAIRKPVIAAVNGVAAGGGMEIVLNCDLAIAAETARFALTEVRIGSIPAVGGIQRLLRSLPRPVAMQLLLTGDFVDASFALHWGLVSEVVAPEQLLGRAKAIASTIARNAPLAVRAAKMLADKAEELPIEQATQLEELLWGHLYGSADRIEGRRAFSEKRKPVFVGR